MLHCCCFCELVLRPGSCGGGCFSSMAEAGGTGVNSMWPITAVLSPSISGSSTMFGVRQSFWIGLLGGCKIWGIGRQSQRLQCRSVRRRFLLQHCDDDGRCAPFAGCLAAEIAGGLGECCSEKDRSFKFDVSQGIVCFFLSLVEGWCGLLCKSSLLRIAVF